MDGYACRVPRYSPQRKSGSERASERASRQDNLDVEGRRNWRIRGSGMDDLPSIIGICGDCIWIHGYCSRWILINSVHRLGTSLASRQHLYFGYSVEVMVCLFMCDIRSIYVCVCVCVSSISVSGFHVCIQRTWMHVLCRSSEYSSTINIISTVPVCFIISITSSLVP